jgi:hypothetical protein
MVANAIKIYFRNNKIKLSAGEMYLLMDMYLKTDRGSAHDVLNNEYHCRW